MAPYNKNMSCLSCEIINEKETKEKKEKEEIKISFQKDILPFIIPLNFFFVRRWRVGNEGAICDLRWLMVIFLYIIFYYHAGLLVPGGVMEEDW